jgi:hypothetical protein
MGGMDWRDELNLWIGGIYWKVKLKDRVRDGLGVIDWWDMFAITVEGGPRK